MTATALPDTWAATKPRPEMFLLICFYDPAGVSTVPENVAFLQRLSRFSIAVVNLFEHRRADGSLGLSASFNLDRFDGVIVHNSISYNVDNLRCMDADLRTPLAAYSGVKVLMKQDENYRFRELARYMGETGFDLVFTCLPDEAIELVYPAATVGKVRYSRMLTGYVTPTLRGLYGSDDRDVDIGYRGSMQPLDFGRLAYEKRKIGSDVSRLLADSGLSLDISSRWEDRLGSDAWLVFLQRCKATLGAESGASIFDLDGDLDARLTHIKATLGPAADDDDYAEAFLAALGDLEGRIYYNQISPRHFEAAATRTLQIMFPGSYSGIFVAGRHYVELARDYSNLAEVVELMGDESRRTQIVECAYEEIINNPEYWIETFVDRFDGLVSTALREKGKAQPVRFLAERRRRNVLLVCAHKPSIDPRLEWVAKYAPEGVSVVQVGVLAVGSPDPRMTLLDDGRLVLAEPRQTFHHQQLEEWQAAAGNSRAGWAAISELDYCSRALMLDEPEFLSRFAAPGNSDRVGQFRWYLRYVLDTTTTLVNQVLALREFDLIVATDLDALPAALIAKGMFGVPVIYDAHEYWPESDVKAFEFERHYWEQMEMRLVPHADHCQTVSPGLAELMGRQYGVRFHVVPNCEPLAAHESPSAMLGGDGMVRFLFQGNFAPKRGLDLLIQAWPQTDVRAILVLRGPDNDDKTRMIALARDTGLFGTRILFLPPVAEHELVAAAREGDVGLIPYTPTGANYTNCCPNKTSQYMAAGIPILANHTRFVAELVEDAKAGLVVDFQNQSALVEAVTWFIDNEEARSQMAANAVSYYQETFHWQQVSKAMYRSMVSLMQDRPATNLSVYAPKVIQPLFIGMDPTPTTATQPGSGTLSKIMPSQPAVVPAEQAPASTVNEPVLIVGPVMIPEAPILAGDVAPSFIQRIWRRLPRVIKRPLLPLARRVLGRE